MSIRRLFGRGLQVRLRSPKFPAWDVLQLCLQRGFATGIWGKTQRLGRLRHVVSPGLPNAESLGLRSSESRKRLLKSSAAEVSKLVGLQD